MDKNTDERIVNIIKARKSSYTEAQVAEMLSRIHAAHGIVSFDNPNYDIVDLAKVMVTKESK